MNTITLKNQNLKSSSKVTGRHVCYNGDCTNTCYWPALMCEQCQVKELLTIQ